MPIAPSYTARGAALGLAIVALTACGSESTAASNAAQGNAEAQSISRIDAIGNVFFSSQKETAQGEQGVYDVDKGTVTMNGAVVLTSGENVIKGTRLVMNLNTGTSTMDDAPTASGKPGRVRGLFVPSQSATPAQPAQRR